MELDCCNKCLVGSDPRQGSVTYHCDNSNCFCHQNHKEEETIQKGLEKLYAPSPNQQWEEWIQKDLDDGKFGAICSNETTFKKYIFPIISSLLEEERDEGATQERERITKILEGMKVSVEKSTDELRRLKDPSIIVSIARDSAHNRALTDAITKIKEEI